MNRLRMHRMSAELTQYKIARMVGMSQAKYSAIERGDVDPNPTDKKKIAAALGVNAEYLWSERS